VGVDTYTWELWHNGSVKDRVTVRDVQGPFDGNPEIVGLFQDAAHEKGSYVLLTRNSRGVELIASFYCGYSDYFFGPTDMVEQDLMALEGKIE
jgi:hypothetical protein